SNGFATAPTLTANSQPGSFNVTASVMKSDGTTVSTASPFSLTNNVPAGSTMSPSGTPQSVTTLSVFAPLKVTVKDASNSPIVGAGVKFQVNTSGSDYTQIATATFGGCTTGGCSVTVATDASGVATAPDLTASPVGGSYTVTASIGSLTASFA